MSCIVMELDAMKALNMAKLGFKVKELIGGIEWWKFDGYATIGIKASRGEAVTCAC
jgi:hypothetical protein